MEYSTKCDDQMEYNSYLTISQATAHQKLALVKWISRNYKGSTNHTKILVIFLQLTKKVMSLSNEMCVDCWTMCEQETTDKGASLPINNMTCATVIN